MIKFARVFALAAVAAGICPLADAEPATIEQRLDRLEAALQRIEARLGETVPADELAPALKEYSDLTAETSAAAPSAGRPARASFTGRGKHPVGADRASS